MNEQRNFFSIIFWVKLNQSISIVSSINLITYFYLIREKETQKRHKKSIKRYKKILKSLNLSVESQFKDKDIETRINEASDQFPLLNDEEKQKFFNEYVTELKVYYKINT